MSNPIEIVGDVISDSKVKELLNSIDNISKSFDTLLKGVSDQAKEYDKSMDKIIKSTDELNKSVQDLDATTEKGAKEIVETNKAAKELSKTYTSLKGQVVELEGSQQKLIREQEEFNEKAKETIRVNKEREKLTQRLAKLNTEEAKDIAELKVQIQEKNKELRENAKATLGVVKQQSEFSKNQSRLTDLLEQNTGAFGAATQGAKTFGMQLKALAKNPIVLVITVIVGLLAALFEGFKKTAGGAQFLEQVSAALSAIWDTLFGQLGKLISGTISFREFLTGTGDAIRANAEAAIRYTQALRQLARFELATAQGIAAASKELAKLAAIRDNDAVSLERRRKAGIAFAEEQEKQAQRELDLAIQRRDILSDNITGLESEEELREKQKELSEAIVEVYRAEANQIEANAEARIQLALIELDIFEQELDLLLDIGDRQKTINEQRAAQTKDLREQKQLFEENTRIIEDSFQDQIKLFEELGGEFKSDLSSRPDIKFNSDGISICNLRV